MGSRDFGALRCRLLLLSGLVPLLSAAPAFAQELGPFDAVGAGVFVGYTFGDERGLDWGIEGFGTRYFRSVPDCGDSSARSGFGPLVRFSALNVSRFSSTLAGHAGGELRRSYLAADLELGGSLSLTRDGAAGSLHTGVTLESLIFNVYARQEWLRDAYSIGGGARFFPTFGTPGFCEVGRAFRGERGQPRARATRAARRFDGRSPDAARWAERARDECASVLAFLQLGLELLELGAPLELVARAVHAAEEELTHTWEASALASRFGGARLVACSPAPRLRKPLPRRRQLQRLARESWLDGCLNEGFAAALARAEASETRDAEEARVSALIAEQEAGHAELAFDVLKWCSSQDRTLTLPTRRPPAMAFERSLLPRRALTELGELSRKLARARLAELPAPLTDA
jgi:hypothetical protein